MAPSRTSATPDFKDFAAELQTTPRQFLGRDAKKAMMQNPLARRAYYGQHLSASQMIRAGKQLQDANTEAFAQYRSASSVYKKVQAKEAKAAAEGVLGSNRKRAGWVKAKQIAAEGKAKAVALRNITYRKGELVRERAEEYEAAKAKEARAHTEEEADPRVSAGQAIDPFG